MKELGNNNKLSEKESIESVVKKKQEVEYKYDSTIKPKSRSHQVWEINTKTLEVGKAEHKTTHTFTWWDALKLMGGTYRDEVIKKKDCVYISSLNAHSALKRYKENKGSSTQSKGIGIKLGFKF